MKDQVERLIHPDLLCLDKLWIEEKQDDWKVIGQYSNVSQQHRSKSPTAKTDSISIEDIRALGQRLMETGSSRHLCCLIRSVERMQSAAANSFLKALEEPPPRVVFILTAESEHSLLKTVASRTRILRFHPLPKKSMRPLLEGHEDNDGAFALHLSQGAPGELLSLLGDPDALRSKRQLHSQAKQFWQARNLSERLSWIMTYADSKKNMEELLLHLWLTLREHPEDAKRSALCTAYMNLVSGLETNAHRGLLLQRFALAVESPEC
ncbi:hypothetical protein EXS65_02780 [Candidatus Peribacteria bacterium]|nr:hypothetical protein [Candidatus Peribacteria bacterium]